MMQNPHDNIVQSLSTQRSSINNSHSKLPFLYSVQIVQYLVKVKYWIWIIYTKLSDTIRKYFTTAFKTVPAWTFPTPQTPSLKKDKKRQRD